MTEEQICEKLQQVLKPGRYRHTLGVADTAERMATVWHVSPAQARLAGLLHDCGKEAGDALSHGPIGARLACTGEIRLRIWTSSGSWLMKIWILPS